MGSPSYFGKLANFEASLRKPMLVPFGLFSPQDKLAFIADIPGIAPFGAINVMSFGAVGNGVADDTAAIAAALATVSPAPPGAELYFPPGIYKTTGNYDISRLNGLNITGAGAGVSIIRLAHPTNDLFYWTTAISDFTMSDLSVTSDTVVRTAGWVLHGDVAYTGNSYMSRSRIYNLDIKKQVNGFWFAQFNLVWVTRNMMTNFVGSNGIAIKAGQTAATAVNQGAGLYLTDNEIYGNDFVGSDPIALGTGLWIEDCDAVETNGGEIGGTVNGNIKIVAGGYGVHNTFLTDLISDATQGQQGAGLYVTGTGTVTELFVRGGWYSSAGNAAGGNSAANGIKIDVASLGRVVIDTYTWLNKGTAVYITNPGGTPVDLKLTGTNNGSGNNSNNKDFIFIDSGINAPSAFVHDCLDQGSTGVSLRTSATTNLLDLGINVFASGQSFGISPRSGVVLRAQSAVFTGSAMTAGQAVSFTTSVPGAIYQSFMTIETTPLNYLGDGFDCTSYISANDVVTTVVQCRTSGTPATNYFALRISN